MPVIQTKGLSISYGANRVVTNIDLKIPESKITTIIGANGCGKSTVLKTLARILSPSAGGAYLDGKLIHKANTKEMAKQLAILPQSPDSPSGLKVGELVSYGRAPRQKGFGKLSNEDQIVIDQSLELAGMLKFKQRDVDELSGGQRQKVWIAMALAQETPVLLLDEPTTYLDLAHQLEVLKILKRLNEEEGRTVVMVLHDLNHASRFADYMIAMGDGAIIQDGSPNEIMTPQVLKKVFNIDAIITRDPVNQKPTCITYDLFE
ncbi:ABC transporter ATP-binding protein [Marinococcus luteus]|uniref:ABC transporter ATP-binding protein n=1 Tax=Marinococcus luteus TaxID=1122204 RepID=UPI002ACCCA1E|nr:ABC transporter ATP-binding protein [Marinococcus luteus]MDZ5783134.1 ABC transporter ATP-binding protein [Marinococcus luteus]